MSTSERPRHFKTTSKEEERMYKELGEKNYIIEQAGCELVKLRTEKERMYKELGEKNYIIGQAGCELVKLRKEKDDVIRQSASEITRLRLEVEKSHRMCRNMSDHMKKQDCVISFLRRSLSASESSMSFLEPFNHVGAF